MSKSDKMFEAMKMARSAAVSVDKANCISGATAALSALSSAATYANTISNEVNHCPAVQQWAVCTP